MTTESISSQERTVSRGLGDTIAKITRFLGIPHCSGCEWRRQKLNELLPYRSARRETAASSPRLGLPRRSASRARRPESAAPGDIPREFLEVLDQQLRQASGQSLILPGQSLARFAPFADQQVEAVRIPILLHPDAGDLRWPRPLSPKLGEGDQRNGPDARRDLADMESARRERRGGQSSGSPDSSSDAAGSTFYCGVDVTPQMIAALQETRRQFAAWSTDWKNEACDALCSLRTGGYAWDIKELHSQVKHDVLNSPYRPACATSGATPACGSSVTVTGSCHYAGSANYVIFGVMCDLCYQHYQDMLAQSHWYNIIDRDYARKMSLQFDEAGMFGLIDLYKKYVPLLSADKSAPNLVAAKRWALAGRAGWPTGAKSPPPDRANCQATCPHAATELYPTFTISWYPRLNPYSG